MHAVGVFFLHALSALFLIGLAGSAVVVLITFVEDFGELFGREEAHSEAPHVPPPASAPHSKP